MGQACPICDEEVKTNPRHPRYLCRARVGWATDENAEQVHFFQSSPDGRYAARYVATGDDYPSHECCVDGVKCWADEARFGGIIVQVI